MKRSAVLVIPGLMFIGACSGGGSSGTSSPPSDNKSVATTAGSTATAPTTSPGASTTTTAAPSATPTTTTTVAAAPTAKDGTAIAEALKTKIPSVQKVVTITEDNDPNNLIGRPTGYVNGAVVYDSGGQCDKLSVDCGATIEVWPSAEAAKTRSEYIQGIQKGAPILGTEYHYLNGPALLRVTGKLKPTAAKEYESALSGG